MEKTYKLPSCSLALLALGIGIPVLCWIYMYFVGCVEYGSTTCYGLNGYLLFLAPWIVAWIAVPAIAIAVILLLGSFIWRKKKGLYISKLHRITSLILTLCLMIVIIVLLNLLI
jgi:hypothetical protein